jgi:putative ABC transport system permease protein
MRFGFFAIVGDVRQQALAVEPRPDVYQSWLQRPDGLNIVVRTSDRGLLRTLSAPGATIAGVEIVEAKTLADHVRSTVREPHARMMLFVILGAVVLLLTVVGVAGLTAHIVSRRTREAGIRLALGARPGEILTLMIGQSAAPIATGVVAGWMVAWWASRFMESFLFQVAARDPWTFVAGTLLLMVAGLAAAWLPARRAARLDPAVTLRQE